MSQRYEVQQGSGARWGRRCGGWAREEERSLDYARDDRMSKRARRSEGLARRGGEKDEERFHREKTRDGGAVLSPHAVKYEERFLSAQADTFAGANVKGKASACFVRNDGGAGCGSWVWEVMRRVEGEEERSLRYGRDDGLRRREVPRLRSG